MNLHLLTPLVGLAAAALLAPGASPPTLDASRPGVSMVDLTCVPAPAGSTAVRVQGRVVTFRLELWRDSMPARDKPGPLIASLEAGTADSRGLPSDFTVTSLRLNHRRAAWRPKLSKVATFAHDPARMQYVAHAGPTWPIGTRVSASLTFRAGGRTYLVRLSQAQIAGVY